MGALQRSLLLEIYRAAVDYISNSLLLKAELVEDYKGRVGLETEASYETVVIVLGMECLNRGLAHDAAGPKGTKKRNGTTLYYS